MKLHFNKINLPFKYPFTISKGTKTHQPSLLVSLSIGNYTGYGEAPAINYYNITVEKMMEDLHNKRKLVEQFALTDPERYWHYLHHLFPKNPFLVCALDMAAWGLWGNIKGLPLNKLWGKPFSGEEPMTDYTIGIDRIEIMVNKIKEKPWPIYKVKMGVENDIELLSLLRLETSAKFRVDVNEGWTTEEALIKIPHLAQMGVELVEQPLKKDNWEGMKQLFKDSPIPLFADESCVLESDVEKCQGHFHGINIKLTKCSGITPARRMIHTAKSLGLEVMMGSMNETTVGSAAVVQFLPQLDYVDVDGPLLLAQDVADGLVYNLGKVQPNETPGLGIIVKPVEFMQ